MNGREGGPSSTGDLPAGGLAPLKLVAAGTDKERAEEFKLRLVEVYKPLLALLDEIAEAGLEAHVGTQMGPLGKNVIATLQIIKRY